MKKALLTFGIVVVIIALYIAYIETYRSAPLLPFSTEIIDTDYYTIKVSAPYDTKGLLPEVHSAVTAATSAFEKQFTNLSADDIKTLGLGGGRKYDLDISTRIATSSDTVSYTISIYENIDGTHATTTTKTFTYNKAGSLIKNESDQNK